MDTGILDQINEYKKSNRFCDVVIQVGETKFKAHKVFLAASSGYFADNLNNDSVEIKVDDVDPDDFGAVLEFVYTGTIDINDGNVTKFKEMAEKLKLPKLEDACEKLLTGNVEVPVANGTDFEEDNHNIPDTSNECPQTVEIIRSKPVSIFPISKRSERKAKQDAYLTMNQAFEIIEDFEEGSGSAKRRNRRPSDEDYHYEHVVPTATSAPVTKRRRSSKSKQLTCMTCYKRFYQGMDYQLHLLCHDNDISEDEGVDSAKLLETMEKAEISRSGLKPAVLPKQAHLLCGLCDKTFANPHNLSVHLKTHSKNDDSNDTQSKKEKREFPCPTCMKIFKTSSHLKRHMITHTGVRKHCCTTCGKLFLKNDHLKRHERTHTSERPFACEECGKTFRDKDHLKRHHLTHSDVRPFFCDICGKQFKERNTLKSHLKIHSASSCACNLCGRSFKSSASLERHLEKHKQDKAHVCEVCGKNFEMSGRLRKHMLTHTGDRPHHCETCGKQFRDPHSLRLHQKRHTGIGLHTCTECGKDFTNPFHLKRHLRIHSGEKPYKCDVCERTFARTDNLEAHKRSCVAKQQNSFPSSSPTSLPSMVTFINHIPSEVPSEKSPPRESNTSSSLTNILSQISWPEPTGSIITSQKDSDLLAKEAEKTATLGNILSQMAWSEPRPSSHAMHEEPANLEKCMNLALPVTSSDETLPTSSPPTLIPRQHAKIFPPNSLGISLPPSNHFANNPDFVRSRYYALHSQLHSQNQSGIPTSRQYSQVQMPTPLHSNQVSSTPDPSQQIQNFDVNAAVNSFIGYGAGL